MPSDARHPASPSGSEPAAARQRHLHLGYMYWANGTHPAGWRYPGAEYQGAFNAKYIAKLAQIAEAAKFDFFFFGDRLATGVDYEFTNTSVMARIEPFTTASYVATQTSKIGLIVTANPTYYDPVTLADLMASLDHVTHGRASWNIVTGADGRAAQNYSRGEHGDATARYDRADEFVDVVRKLWDSWEDGALGPDAASGELFDARKIHPLNHKGAAFEVADPLPVARPPEGQLVILHAGTSERSRDLGAREADVLFAGAGTIEAGKAYTAEIRRKAVAYGRNPDHIYIMPGLTPIVGETLAEARQIYDRLNTYLVLDDDIRFGGKDAAHWLPASDRIPVRREDQGPGQRNLGALSQRVGVDLTALGIDDPVTDTLAATFNAPGKLLLATTTDRTGRRVNSATPPTLRDLLYSHIVGAHIIVGGPVEVADYMEAWLDQGASHGFNIQSPFLFDQLLKFVDLVLPELRRRGLYRSEYAGNTLREHLGLDRPQNRWDAPLVNDVASVA